MPSRHENMLLCGRVVPKEGCRSVAQPHCGEPHLCSVELLRHAQGGFQPPLFLLLFPDEHPKERSYLMTKKQKKTLKRIIISEVLYLAIILASKLVAMPWYLELVLFLVPYFIIGHDVLRKAVLGIVHGEVFDENFLMAVATVGALCLGEFSESVAVMLFYQIGELFQSYAVGKSRKSISDLMDIRPDSANLETAAGAE